MPDRAHLLGQTLILLVAGCSGAEDPCVAREPAMMAQASGWTIVDAAADPFDDRPNNIDCLPVTITVEGAAVEVSTDECSYVTLIQPLATEIQRCESLAATVAHFPLVSNTATATAHLALRAGDTTLFDRTLSIPKDAEVFQLTTPGPFPAETPLYFHLHNHGSNTYYLTDVRRVATSGL